MQPILEEHKCNLAMHKAYGMWLTNLDYIFKKERGTVIFHPRCHHLQWWRQSQSVQNGMTSGNCWETFPEAKQKRFTASDLLQIDPNWGKACQTKEPKKQQR